ncbi:hypothetical protein P5815_28845 [Bacillus cereus]|uniref:hypothetical protein n=1 Tax=Bacillus cereus TaxID=1396 RepID=UPI002406F17E|nr:hypothetical protein [Bacillus cereus]MDF9524501.1 hypothetical protein [Bacillus cereus]MDF9564180.1 hypothetical protein [Bacillus cereus]
MQGVVEFVMINPKKQTEDFNFETYTNEIFYRVLDQIKTLYGIKNFNFYSNKTYSRECSLFIDVHEYRIIFTYIPSDVSPQLKVDIAADFFLLQEPHLHVLKIELKDALSDGWEHCLWLEDKQAVAYSEVLYREVHSVENALRKLINTILFYRLGGNWWEEYMSSKLKNTYGLRNDPYAKRARSFRNVHTNLMSIDTKDLLEILTFKTYKVKKENVLDHSLSGDELSKKYHFIMNEVCNGNKLDSYTTDLTKILMNTVEIDLDFWKDYFEPWFSCSLDTFKGKWNAFSHDRNHVAHNKLIDDKLFKKYRSVMSDLLKIIREAEKKFNDHFESKTEKYLEELEKRKIQREAELYERQKMYEESGGEYLQEEEIVSLLTKKIIDTFHEIEEKVYYRSDIEIISVKPNIYETDKVFEIAHRYLDKKIYVTVESQIDGSQSGVSDLQLTLYSDDDIEETYEISFTNGSVSFDEDQGVYVPIGEKDLDIAELSNLERDIDTLIENYMPEIESTHLAGFRCEECKKFAINIADDNGFDIGACLNCGHINGVGECTRCGIAVDSSEDELCFSCEAMLLN